MNCFIYILDIDFIILSFPNRISDGIQKSRKAKRAQQRSCNETQCGKYLIRKLVSRAHTAVRAYTPHAICARWVVCKVYTLSADDGGYYHTNGVAFLASPKNIDFICSSFGMEKIAFTDKFGEISFLWSNYFVFS